MQPKSGTNTNNLNESEVANAKFIIRCYTAVSKTKIFCRYHPGARNSTEKPKSFAGFDDYFFKFLGSKLESFGEKIFWNYGSWASSHIDVRARNFSAKKHYNIETRRSR